MSQVGKGKLQLEAEGDNHKVWLNPDGISFNEDAPVIHSETYFPFIENPLELMHILLNKYHHYDMRENKIKDELKKHRSTQLRVYRLITKRNVVGPREIIEKKAYFQLK